jgi:TRAP-type C4-dicarboxylate transport system substrate-binding protein
MRRARHLLAVGLLLGVTTGGAEAATVIRWGDVLSADHPAVKMIERVAKRVADATQGRIFVPRLVLGG